MEKSNEHFGVLTTNDFFISYAKIFQYSADLSGYVRVYFSGELFGAKDGKVTGPLTVEENGTLKIASSTINLQNFYITGGEISTNLKLLDIANNFDYMMKYHTSSNPLILKNPNVPALILFKNGNGFSDLPYNSSPDPTSFPVTINSSGFTPGNITYKTDGAGLQFSPSQITISQNQIETGAGASYTFQFLPGDQTSATLSFTTANTAGYTTTNGTSDSTTQSKSPNFSVSAAVSAEVDALLAKSSATLTTTAGYENAWSKMQSINFSESSNESTTDTVTNSITVKPGTATKNSDGTYTYTQSEINNNGKVTTYSNGFIPALWYTAHITKNGA